MKIAGLILYQNANKNKPVKSPHMEMQGLTIKPN